MNKRGHVPALVALILSAVMPPAAGASVNDWLMTQKDSDHSGFSIEGPKPPLRRAWRATTNSQEGGFTTWPVHKDQVVFARSGTGILAADAITGKRKWFHEPREGMEIVSPALDDERIVIPVANGILIALNQKTGKEVWRFTASSRITISPTVYDQKVFVGASEAKTIYAINVRNGGLIWETKLDLEPFTIPAASKDAIFLNLRNFDTGEQALVSLDAKTGAEKWRIPQRDANSSPSILGDKIVIGSGDFFAHALNPETGEEIWRSPVIGKFGIQNSPAVAYGDVFLADRLGNVYRIDGETGKRKWVFEETRGTFMQSFPVVAGKTLFIGSGAGWLYAIDVDSGTLLWKHQVGGFILSGAADEKHFYFGVKFRNEGLYAFEHDPTGGKNEPKAGDSSAENGTEGVPLAGILTGLLVAAALIGGVALIASRKRS